MIFRLSQKLAKKIKAGPLKPMPLDENPYADWSCHLFTVSRQQFILLSNTQSLYSCLLFGKGINSEARFAEQALNAIRGFMHSDGQMFVYERFIAPASGSVNFARALNRSVIGSMNELIFHAKWCLEPGTLSPLEVSFEINDLLLSALASEASRGYGKPSEAFKKLAEEYRLDGGSFA